MRPATEPKMDIQKQLINVLDEVLSLSGRAAAFGDSTPLLGAIPELDSMAVISLITAMEDRFDIVFEDDEVDGDTFATLGSLKSFVRNKMDGQ